MNECKQACNYILPIIELPIELPIVLPIELPIVLPIELPIDSKCHVSKSF